MQLKKLYSCINASKSYQVSIIDDKHESLSESIWIMFKSFSYVSVKNQMPR